MHDQDADLVFRNFVARNIRGLKAIRHHLDKQELTASTDKLLSDIADHLHAQGFDGKHKRMPGEYRELLLELATIIGPLPVLLESQRGRGISGDYELVRCLLNQLQEYQDELVIEQIPAALKSSQFNVGMLLVRFYLHKLPAGRKPERRLNAVELYSAFEALGETVAFQSQGDEELAEMEIMRLFVDTGFVHHILYRAKTGRMNPSQAFFDALRLLKPAEQNLLRQFHARKKA